MGSRFAAGFLTISGLMYLMLLVNVLTALTTLPLLVLLLATDWSKSWLLLAGCSALLAPALFAAFACFRAQAEGSLGVFGTYWKAWWLGLRRAGPLGLSLAGLLVVIGVDVYAATLSDLVRATLGFLVVVAVLALLAWLVAIEALEEDRDVGRWSALKGALWCSVKAPGWSLLTLAALVVLVAMFWAGPVLVLCFATGPGCYLVWASCRRVLSLVRVEVPAGAPHPHLAAQEALT
ncbi:MAG: hypothetical protein LBH11_07570 [Propionibacteriaceae bacterium]|jgi:uncharacterized membrane protein YesL|nr:hypothetical protein [Propionibacteriaceae bacterium]